MRKIIPTLALAVILTAQASAVFAFGAIAVNDSQGTAASEAGYGLGWGTTRKEAERNAVKECKSAGNDECEVAVWFERCGAYAGDRVNYGIGYGETKKAAEKMSLKDCPKCQIIVSDCQ
ncbi:DUF4189 domain-containing protein [Neorhizobium lilium]|uniref:DUF4189 domain-containing protein n=1 Tax=Neorhizobium lilium TaxID=2503024 RepID=A0A3S4UVM7_9HYPH|nr:DUF4189 domain-containing protein [Neorhizobium lilium]RWX81798.1 DUF4189 domain-containing protein [Neorhizobium lilium]